MSAALMVRCIRTSSTNTTHNFFHLIFAELALHVSKAHFVWFHFFYLFFGFGFKKGTKLFYLYC
jgi:hypothetical protein